MQYVSSQLKNNINNVFKCKKKMNHKILIITLNIKNKKGLQVFNISNSFLSFRNVSRNWKLGQWKPKNGVT